MQTYRLEQLGDGMATLNGYDMPDAEIVGKSPRFAEEKIIAIKVPGHSYQYGYSSVHTVSYAPAQIKVYKVIEGDLHSDDTLVCQELIGFPVRKQR